MVALGPTATPARQDRLAPDGGPHGQGGGRAYNVGTKVP